MRRLGTRDYDHVLVLAGDHLYRMDYREMFDAHIQSSADITVGVLPVPKEDCAGFGVLLTAADGQIRAFREKPRTDEELAPLAPSKELRDRWGLQPGQYLASMGVYVFRMETLREALANPANMDFGRDILPGMIGSAQGPGVPVPRLLARHRDDPELLRGEPRADGRRPAVPLLPPRRADLHEAPLPPRLVARRRPLRPLPPRRRREDLRGGDRAERHRPPGPDREGVPDRRVDPDGGRRHRGRGRPRRRAREGDPAGRDRRGLRHREGHHRQERPDRRGVRPPRRPVAPRPGRRRLVPPRRDRHRPEERASSSPEPSSEERPGGRPPGLADSPVEAPTPPVSFVLVLHGHIPAVLGHGVWPHGADWLLEAAAETYLPFVAAVRALDADGVPWKATVGLTPILCEQLRDPRFPRGFRRYVRHRLAAASRDAREFARDGHRAERARPGVAGALRGGARPLRRARRRPRRPLRPDGGRREGRADRLRGHPRLPPAPPVRRGGGTPARRRPRGAPAALRPAARAASGCPSAPPGPRERS